MSQTSADRGPNWGDAGQVWPGFGQLEFGPCLSQLGHFRSTFLGLGEESNAQPESLKAFRGPSSRWGLGGGPGPDRRVGAHTAAETSIAGFPTSDSKLQQASPKSTLLLAQTWAKRVAKLQAFAGDPDIKDS